MRVADASALVLLLTVGCTCEPDDPWQGSDIPDGPLEATVLYLPQCRPFDPDPPEHGPIPWPDTVEADGLPGGAVRVRITDADGSCPDAPEYRARADDGFIHLESHHSMPGGMESTDGREFRDITVRISGVPAGTHQLAFVRSYAPGTRNLFEVTVE